MPYEILESAPAGRYEVLPDAPAAEPALSRVEKFIKGVRDPLDGGAQLLTKMLPDGLVKAGNTANNWLSDKTGMLARLPDGGIDQQVRDSETAYQGRRTASGETGIDGYRMLGNIASPANLAIGAGLTAPASIAGRVGMGALGGAASAALNPVTSKGDYTEEKATQIGLGAAFGGAIPALTGGIARVISPNASINPNLQLLKNEGVKPTIGQSLGGWANSAEEKAMSVPIMGDMIARARQGSREQFNNAAINRAAGKVGGSIEGTGQGAVKEAGDLISRSYDDAINQIKVVKFDPKFGQDLTQLQSMAQSLTPPMRAKFNQKLDEVVGGRMTGTGSMLGGTFKKVDSEIAGLASKFQGSAVASESELGDAFGQLRNLLKEQAIRSNPKAADAINAADAGWANLVRIEAAAKSAKNSTGIFTPGQLNMAIQQSDQSVRGRAVARGTALMQDLGNAGQQVLGNKIPNSGTADRLMLGAGGLGAYALNPAIPLSLLGGAAMYTKPMQGLLSGMASTRPQGAQAVADAFRKAAPGLAPLGAQVGLGLLN